MLTDELIRVFGPELAGQFILMAREFPPLSAEQVDYLKSLVPMHPFVTDAMRADDEDIQRAVKILALDGEGRRAAGFLDDDIVKLFRVHLQLTSVLIDRADAALHGHAAHAARFLLGELPPRSAAETARVLDELGLPHPPSTTDEP